MKYFLLIFSLVITSRTLLANTCYSEVVDVTINSFEVYTANNQAIILFDKKGSELDSIISHQLAEDIFKVTNYKPKVVSTIKEAQGHVIVIGGFNSKFIKKFLDKQEYSSAFTNQWESYLYKTVVSPNKKIKKAFVIAGTNSRGTAYGVFNISKNIGVSPWYWWADVPVKKRNELILNQSDFQSNSPSVKYRGIFLNDEDWGLQPWAEKTFEPETGDIGPKTYSKIFELLLRLNANTIWPAMHPSTKAFFHYPENAKMAKLYNIVVGTSHAEPMLRNNVDEWDKKKMGAFNYKTNKNTVYNYWESRVKEAEDIDAIYSMGMRGVHDSGMEGVKSKDEAVALLDDIIKDQRSLLKTHINKNVVAVPQALTVYKEVLDLYKNGLKVPDDITLVWTDDNYGYIRALSNTKEQKRSGGGGVYYHASYWGRPHDYLWLSTTNPHLIKEEMIKAYNLNNKDIWILNVGDIKPAEYNMQLFLDMAYDADKFQNPKYIKGHQQEFYGHIFGDEFSEQIAKIRTSYFQLAFERKPEFMGWSQTEKTTPIYNTAYSALTNGDEIQQRLDAYSSLKNQVETIKKQIPKNTLSAFTQLVSYPIEASVSMNEKFLYRDKALVYAKQGRQSALKYKALSNKAFQNIVDLTNEYNALFNGKWQGIMDMKPRRLPVFDNPEIELKWGNTEKTIGVSVEGMLKNSERFMCLPTFYVGDDASYFIDVFLNHKQTEGEWVIEDLPNWIKASAISGVFNSTAFKTEHRINIFIDWELWKKEGAPDSKTINIKTNTEEKRIQINISKTYNNIPIGSFVEKNGYAVLYANHFSKNKKSDTLSWKEITGLGHSKAVMQSSPLDASPVLSHEKAPVLEYDLYTETLTEKAEITLIAIPTHPLTTSSNLRIGVQWNDDPVEVIDFKTKGRSNVWKQNVLSNKAIKTLKVSLNKKGKQKLKIYMIDSGVLLDYMVLNTSNKNKLPYILMSETKL